MKLLAYILTALILLSNTGVISAEPPRYQTHGNLPSAAIQWQTNYTAAVAQAKETHKPILLFFTGTDWCSWCNKLEEEVFARREFADMMQNTFIFVRLDYPRSQNQMLPLNKQLLNKHNVKTFPTVLILDEQEHVIGKTGYQAGGARQYATHLSSLIQGYLKYQSTREVADAKPLSHDELRQLYEKAQEFHNTKEASALLSRGLENDRNQYFLCEKYRTLVEEGKTGQPDTLATRARILEQDPNNEHYNHYKIALIDYQCLQKESNPELATAPLVEYLQKFGETDQVNGWKVEMTISQSLLSRGLWEESLQHAHAAYQRAPSNVKPNVQKAIEQIKRQIGDKLASR